MNHLRTSFVLWITTHPLLYLHACSWGIANQAFFVMEETKQASRGGHEMLKKKKACRNTRINVFQV
jgi:hypothetical protein